jgi:Mannose-6-phosphate isomerase
MRKALVASVWIMSAFGLVAPGAAQPVHSDAHANTSESNPLVLRPGDGEPRLRRLPPAALSGIAAPFLIKVDPTPQNGAAQDFFVFTESVPVGASIAPHKHPHAEELIFIQDGRGSAWLNGRETKLEPGTIIYMPRNTGVRLVNDGKGPIALVAVFSRQGFDTYQRAISAPAGKPAKPLTAAELNSIRLMHQDSVIYDTKK